MNSARARISLGLMNSTESTKEHLASAARRLFASRGFDGVSVKEICDEAECNISLVSYHFGGKENLYLEAIRPYAEAELAFFEKTLRPAETHEDLIFTLKTFFQHVLENYVERPEVCQIIQRDVEQGQPAAFELFRKTFYPIFLKLVGFFVDAQKKGLLRPDLDAQVCAVMIFGGIQHVTRLEGLRKRLVNLSLQDPDFRNRIVKNALDLFVNGMINPRGNFNENDNI